MKRNARSARDELAHHRCLDARVEHRDQRPVPCAVERDLLRRYDRREVLARHRRLRVDHLSRSRDRYLGAEHAPAHRARVAYVAHERPRVDARDRVHAAVCEPVQPPALRAGRVLAVARLAHDRRASPNAFGLHRLRARTVVADVRVGESDQLAGERGVGHRLLVARHPGREDHLAERGAVRAAQLAPEARAVLEQHVSAAAIHQMMSFCTALNSGVPARSSSSNSAASTVLTTAPARSMRSSPRS